LPPDTPFKVLVKKHDLTLFKTFREAEKPGFFSWNTKDFCIESKETRTYALYKLVIVCFHRSSLFQTLNNYVFTDKLTVG
jgi:hypothetical protein